MQETIEQMQKNKNSKTLVDSYKDFQESGDNIYKVSKDVYRNICIEFNEMLIDHIILDSGEIELPCRLGSLRIKKIKSKNRKMVDWKLTKEYGKLIYHLNMHTDGYYYKWHWKKKSALFTNKSVYSFVPLRRHKREVAQLLKDNKVDYFI
jgi:hypothetical protein